MPNPPRPRGAPKGNHNALKHGIYSNNYTAVTVHLTLKSQLSVLRSAVEALSALEPSDSAYRPASTLAAIALTRLTATFNFMHTHNIPIPTYNQQEADRLVEILVQRIDSPDQ